MIIVICVQTEFSFLFPILNNKIGTIKEKLVKLFFGLYCISQIVILGKSIGEGDRWEGENI